MKTEMYEFNGALYRSNANVTLNFNVALNNLSKFIELIGGRPYYIEKNKRVFNGSQNAYVGKRVTITVPALSMYQLMLNLGVSPNGEVRDNIHVNYSKLATIKNKPLQMVLIWSKSKGYYTQFRNTKVTYKSIYTQGSKERRHIVPIN